MDAAATEGFQSETRPAAWSFAWSWLLGFVLVVYMGLEGGGFDVLVSGQVGIAVWWILLLGLAVGALPRRRPGPAALAMLGVLVAFALWTALSLSWSESFEKTALDLARITSLLGIFALALASRDRGGSHQMVSAVASGIFVIAVIGMLSRLHPSWFPDAGETGQFLTTGRERLSYPLDYWNGLAALIGIGLPLMMHVAHSARTVVARALAAAALPAMMLALLFTLSRGGIASALIALAIFLALSRDRISLALTMAITGAAGGLLVILGLTSHDLVHGLHTASASSEGDRLLWITIVACIVSGLLIAGLALLGQRYERPGWTRVSRTQSQVAVGAVVVVGVVALLAIGAPDRLSDAWHNFQEPSTESEHGTSRLTSISGENRYQFWSSSIREFESAPLGGTGSGTFQLWWTRDGGLGDPVIDSHNLYVQTLGELGIVGLLLLLALAVGSLWIGIGRTLSSRGLARSALAAAMAGSTVLWLTSVFDWMWKLTIIPAATLLLIAVVITAGDREREEREGGLSWWARGGLVLASVVALVAIAVPLGSESLLRQSQDKAREGDLDGALSDARSAANVEPGAASPRLQEALVLESAGDLEAARDAALAATDREETNWRIWLVLSRIEAQDGEADAALVAYRKARSLAPDALLFEED